MAKELFTMKWYIISVTFTPPAKDITLRMRLRQEAFNAFEADSAPGEVMGALRRESKLKGRKFGRYDVSIHEDEDQTPRV